MFFSLLFTILFSLNTHAATDNCTGFWKNGFPGPGPTPLKDPVPCNKVIDSQLNDTLSLYVDELYDGDSRLPQVTTAIAGAMYMSKSYFRNMDVMPVIKVIIYKFALPGEVEPKITFAASYPTFPKKIGKPEACPIIVYPSALDFNLPHLQQLIAHEMFHCFQMRNARKQTELASQEAGVGLWYIEGTAQQMSDVVFPRSDLEWTDRFPFYNKNLPLTEQDGYANVAFFMSWFQSANQWMDSIYNFILRMPEGTSITQEKAFAQSANAGIYFHHFAERFNAGNIRDRDNRQAPYVEQEPTSEKEIFANNENQYFEFTMKPLMTQYHRLLLPKKGRYTIKVLSGQSEFTHISTRDIDGDPLTWTPFTGVVQSVCELDTRMDFLITSINPDKAETLVKLQINYEEKNDCGCNYPEVPGDQCLVGSWKLDHESTREYFEKHFKDSNNELVSITGDYLINISPNRELDFVLNNWVVTTNTTVQSTNKKVKMETIANGHAETDYADKDHNRVCANRKSGALTFTHVIYLESGKYTTPANPILSPADRKIEFTYQCSGNELIYQYGLGVGADGTDVPYNFKFIRL